MHRRLLLAAALLLSPAALAAQVSIGGLAARAFPVQVTAAQLPTATGRQGLRIVTNAATSASCTVGGGSVVLLCLDSGTWTPAGAGGGSSDAADITIADAGTYYTGTDVEAALQEIGAGTTLDGRYLKRGLNSDVGSFTLDLAHAGVYSFTLDADELDVKIGGLSGGDLNLSSDALSVSVSGGGNIGVSDHAATLEAHGADDVTTAALSAQGATQGSTLTVHDDGSADLDGSALCTAGMLCAGYAAASHTHAAADIVSGILADSLINGANEADEVNPTLGSQTQGNYVASVATTSPITGGADGSEGGTLTIALTQNAGTDVTADLEEETHATEHSLGGADPITATDLASACTNVQVLGGTLAGTGVECQADDDAPDAGDFGAATDLDSNGSVKADAVALGTDTTGSYAAGDAEAGNATGVACTDCVALGSETTGGYAASATEGGSATSVAANSVALGADTTGGYAASSTEGGSATSVAANSVALGTDTTGNYALGDAEGGAATTGDSASNFFSIGIVEAARLGTGTPGSGNYLRGDGSWQAVTVVAPGSDTQCLFNDGGALGADGGCVYNKTTDTLTLAGDLNVGGPLATGHTVASTVHSVSDGYNGSIAFTSATPAWMTNGVANAVRFGASIYKTDAPILHGIGVTAHTEGVGAPYSWFVFGDGCRLITNEGATAKVYISLPTASAQLCTRGYVQDTDGLRFTAASGDTIRVGSSVSATAGYCESTTQGDSATWVAINATEWVAINVVGSGWACT